MEQALARCQEAGSSGALLCVDLDQFKDINDTLGHYIGDILLRTVAQRLQSEISETDTVARLGGDEFGVILQQVPAPETAAKVAERLLESMSRQFHAEGRTLFIGATIGITRFPEDATDIQTLLKYADIAMYAAKNERRQSYRFFDPAMNSQLRLRKMLEDDLHGAIQRDELYVVYQPRLDIPSGRISSLEALLRWRHPERGEIPPAEFIPLAERSGLILEIGEWVLHTACRMMKDLEASELVVDVSINLSPRQFNQRNLAACVHSILEDTGVEPSRVQIEITESMVMSDFEATIEILREIGAKGITFAIDDFGSGHSSLSQLRNLPVDCIKMDGLFIKGLTRGSAPSEHEGRSRDIVKAILGIGGALDLPVVAEEVETYDQFEFLVANRCREIQGNYISPPISADDLMSWLYNYHNETDRDDSRHP